MAPQLTALVTVTGMLGASIYMLDGVPQRLEQSVSKIADFKYEFTTDARYPDCWVAFDSAPDSLAPKCLSPNKQSHSSRILVWGDSHAARLYPGLRKTHDSGVDILQATRSSCPPILNSNHPACSAANAYVLSSIPTMQPDTVLLFAAWGRYDFDWAGDDTKANLQLTIAKLKELGVRRVIVVGPAPEWTTDLPKLLYRSHLTNPDSLPTSRMSSHLNPKVKEIDSALESIATDAKATYFSARRILCNEHGCLTRNPNNVSELTSWDYGHLTTYGAVVVSQGIALEAGSE